MRQDEVVKEEVNILLMFHCCSQKQQEAYKSCSAESFMILDSAASSFQVKIKEALYVKWENPSLRG